MRTIWKYPVSADKQFSLDIPKGAQFLDVQTQGETPVMWFRVESENPPESWHFAVVGTGQPTPDDAEGDDWWHLGTFQMFGGAMVWHLFQRNDWGE